MGRFRRQWLLPALVLPALLLGGGCKDDRGAPTAPDTGALDGDVLYGSALVSSLFFSFQNTLVSGLLALHDSGNGPLPATVHSLCGDGVAVISDNDDSDPNSYRVVLGSADVPFVFNCNSDVPLSFTGRMVVRFVETSPGLEYLIQMEFDHATGTPKGVTMQLPQGFGGGAILSVTTPYDEDPTDAYPQGDVRYTLDRARSDLSFRQAGKIQGRGTLRLEDRNLPLTLVEELSVDHVVKLDSTGVYLVFDQWPGGMYEIASGSPPAPNLPSVPGYPVEVYFNGAGLASYSFEGHDCEVNMQTGDNPCGGL